MRVLDREFHEGSWHWEEANDVVLFALLVQRGRAGEVCTQRWHERLPNHYFAVMHVLCMQLSKPDRPLQEVCPDDSRLELCVGNCIALLAAPERLFACSDGKRARLHERVEDTRLHGVAEA
eukprot:g24110.t1